MEGSRGKTMNYFMRPYVHFGVAALAGAMLAATPSGAAAQSLRISQIITEPNPFAVHAGSQGYLGVLVSDVDSDSASKLKLKEVRGAVITLIDHDAPAAQAGLRVNDVVLEMNGQAIEGAEQFGRMMREVPPGRKVSLVISRDGGTQTIGVQLADRKKMENDVWNKLGNNTDASTSAPGMGILGSGSSSDVPAPSGFHMPFIGSTSLNVGALVEPLTSQMADYLGVSSGLMVKQVGRKSEAAAAGFKAFDVILKIGTDAITTLSDWDRALRANQGKSVQVTILRDKKQQTLTLQVDSKRKGDVEFNGLLPDGPCPMMAFADPAFANDLARGFALNESDIQSMREQSEALADQLKTFQDEGGILQFKVSPEQVEEFRKQAEQFRDAFKGQDFHIDSKQLDQMKKQMEEFHQNFKPENFKPENFKLDEKQLEQLKNQRLLQVYPPNFDEQLREEMKQQMDQLKRQMEEMRALSFGDHV
jgi:serine protease Do